LFYTNLEIVALADLIGDKNLEIIFIKSLKLYYTLLWKILQDKILFCVHIIKIV